MKWAGTRDMRSRKSAGGRARSESQLFNLDNSVLTSETSARSFLDLPNEILEEIGIILPPVDLACLSLVCGRLYRLLCRRVIQSIIFTEQKRDVLLRLEDDSPELLLCHRCIKLFKWRRSRTRLPTPFGFQPLHQSCPTQGDRRHDPGFALCGTGGALNFRRETRDLILRYYRKGPEYGLPIESIEHTCSGMQPMGDDKAIKTSLKVKIVDGNFMIRRTDELQVYLKDVYVREEIFKFHNRICSHLGSYLPAIVLCQVDSIICRLDFDYSAEYRPDSSHRCIKVIHCEFCNTDIRVDIEPHSDKSAVIRVNAWYNFGTRYEYFMSEQKDALKAIRPQRVAGRWPRQYRWRDLEQLYNGTCTHLPREANRCIVFPTLYEYQHADKWTWTVKEDGNFHIELPEGPYRNQLHSRSDLNAPYLQKIALPWVRRGGCDFAEPNADMPLMKQLTRVFSAKMELRRRWEIQGTAGKLVKSVHRYTLQVT